MENIEIARKRRKLEAGGNHARENGVGNATSAVGTSNGSSGRANSYLQFNPSVFERLRKITKDCQKNFSTPKPNGEKISLRTADCGERRGSTGGNASNEGEGCDVIVSSTGSSPAHSPQPSDLAVLSTPPRGSKQSEVPKGEIQKACGNLVERFEQTTKRQRLSNGDITDSTLDHHESAVEVLEEGDRALIKDVSDEASHVNGDVDSLAVKNADIDTAKARESPTLSDVISTEDARREKEFNFDSADFREMLKTMIQERMTLIEHSTTEGRASDPLKDRLAALEKENEALREHAKNVEGSVKKFMAALKEKEKVTMSRAVQTQDLNWFNNVRPKSVTMKPSQSSPAATRPSPLGPNVAVAPTTTTARITSTVALLPGHTLPSSRIEEASQANSHNFYSGPQRINSESLPVLRPRPPVAANVTGIPSQQSSSHYPSTYTPVVSQSAPLRTASAGQNFSSPAPPPQLPFQQGMRAAPPVQAQHPGLRVVGPTSNYNPVSQLSHPVAARPVAPTSNRPLPITVTVHPQTQTPSSSSAVRGPQRAPPPPYGYTQLSTQGIYNNCQTGPRVSVTPQSHSQMPIVAQGGSRPTPYPSSSIQVSSPQHVLQQPRLQAPQPRPQGQQPSPIGSVPISVRPGPPVQMQSPPHAITPPRPQLPGMMHYPSGSPRPVLSAQTSGLPINYATTGVRSPQSTQQGMLQGVVQQPPVPQPSSVAHTKEAPPKPTVSIAVVTSGIVLSWNMPLEDRHASIVNYQLFALQDGGTTESAHQWKKIGVVKALPLPMACTLTQFMPGNKYHFAVRATDEAGRAGPFSDPCTITLK